MMRLVIILIVLLLISISAY
ncbi:TPA: type I toxin-antitoxin system toxin IbsC [Escherichia coli]